MSISYELQVEIRSDQGKGASRRLRRAGKVPGILYGGGLDPQPVALDHHRLLHSIENEGFYSHILTVDVGGKTQKAVLRDLQRHPTKHAILHVDLMRVSETQKIRVQVPLHFVGEDVAPGVKEAGGILSRDLNDVGVECLPKYLPEFIEVDVSQLELGESLHLSDLVLPEGVEVPDLARGHEPVIVSIHVRKAEEVEAAEGIEEVEGVEGVEGAAEDEAPAAPSGEPEAGDGEKS
ncbi:MAG: 50S ribosomal protein L25/general stress protein Ctc [Gammaproteobacteria bacterium]